MSVVVAAAATVLVVVWMGFGVLSLAGILLALPVATLGALALARRPEWLSILVPALMPLGLVWAVFPYELAFLFLCLIVGLAAVHARAGWASRWNGVELGMLGFVAWAVVTGFWATETNHYLLGVRRLVEGGLAFWIARRLTPRIPRLAFELGLVACAALLAGAALSRQVGHGGLAGPARVDRASATDLGWGTANFIATLLLVLMPPLLVMLRSSVVWGRVLAFSAVVLAGFMQVLIASRAAAVLFLGGIVATLATRQWRRAGLTYAAIALFAAAALLTPHGQAFLSRFQNVRDLGSMVVRIWYFRAAWQRTLDHMPWGIGLNQGLTYPDHLQDEDPHNYWLVVTSELGAPGLILWLIVLAALWRQIHALGRDPRWLREARALHVVFWLSQLHSLVEPTFQGVQYQFLYFWVMGGYLGMAERGPAAAAPPLTPAAASSRR